MRLIFKIVLIFFIILAISIIYMSLFGFETKRFNQQIIKSFQNIDQDLEIELNEIKIVLDPFELKFNAKTIGPNIVYKKKIIQIEYLKTNVPLLSIVNRNFLMENLEVSTKSLDLKNFVSFIKVFSNDPKLFLVENAIKKGFLIADINLNFDKDGNIKDNFNINGILKDTKIDILGKYQIDNLNFIFSYGKNNSIINNLNLYINDFKLFSDKIEIKKIGKEFKIDGDFENKEGELNKKNIDFFLNPLFKGYEINKINLNSKSNFSLNITEKLKVKNFTFLSDINLKEMSFSNNYKIKSFFPKIRDEIKLLNNDLSVKFINGILTINGNGKILLQENNDEISYFFEKKRNNTYDFDTSLEIVNNPLKIDFLNYEKDINKKLQKKVNSKDLNPSEYIKNTRLMPGSGIIKKLPEGNAGPSTPVKQYDGKFMPNPGAGRPGKVRLKPGTPAALRLAHKEYSDWRTELFEGDGDHEYEMARRQLATIKNAVSRLEKKMGETGEGELKAWVQSKLTRSADDIDTVADYMTNEENIQEGEKDACYHKVKSRYSVWPSAYASGALVKCRKVGAKNWGNKTKKEEIQYMNTEDYQRIQEYGNVYTIIVLWRGKSHRLQLFFQGTARPSRDEVKNEVEKIYPGGMVSYYFPSATDPGKPIIVSTRS